MYKWLIYSVCLSECLNCNLVFEFELGLYEPKSPNILPIIIYFSSFDNCKSDLEVL